MSLVVYLSRDIEEAPCWTWTVFETGTDELGYPYEEPRDDLPVPYDAESDEYEIGSLALHDALVAAGFDMSQHWFYNDSDYGPIGEWNRPKEVS